MLLGWLSGTVPAALPLSPLLGVTGAEVCRALKAHRSIDCYFTHLSQNGLLLWRGWSVALRRVGYLIVAVCELELCLGAHDLRRVSALAELSRQRLVLVIGLRDVTLGLLTRMHPGWRDNMQALLGRKLKGGRLPAIKDDVGHGVNKLLLDLKRFIVE